MTVFTRIGRQSGGNFYNQLENLGGADSGDRLAALRGGFHLHVGRTELAAGGLGADFALTGAAVGKALATTGGTFALDAGVPTSLGTLFTVAANGYGDTTAFSLSAANLNAIGMDPAAANWDKLQSGLAELFIEAQLSVGGANGEARADALGHFTSVNPGAGIHGGMVAIDAVSSNGDGAALLAQLEALGLERGASYGAMAGGLISIDKLDELSNLGLLGFARPVYATTNVGLTTSQNVQSMNVDYVQQTYGLTGAGIKIGIISDSFNTRTGPITNYGQDVTNGDLPAGVQILQDSLTAASDEGRAMMQLAYDIAPGASFAFHSAFISLADFAQGIGELVAAGCKIVVDDVFYYSEPFFQDGIVAQAVDAATAAGAMYFSSAGNTASNSYESAYRGSGTSINITGAGAASGLYQLHDFDAGAGVDFIQSITKTGTGAATYVLNWDQPFASSGGLGSQSDMAIVIFNAAGTPIAAFTSNNIGADALEIAQSTSTTWAGFAIGLKAGSAEPALMKTVMYGAVTMNEYRTNSSTATGHANAATAISVGASDWADSPRYNLFPIAGQPTPYLEAFSSRGNTPILFDDAGNRLAAPEWRSTVDFTASDGGNNSFFGSDVSYDDDDGNGNGSTGTERPNFFGTSAAAPNAAAIAALLMQRFPTATRDQIETALEQSALDITRDYNNSLTGVGYDPIAGHGLIQADRAFNILAEMVTNGLVLTAGELAIIGYNTDAATAGEPGDLLSFVLLAGLDQGASIFFTDRAWNGTTFAAASAGEGTFQYTAATNIAAGTVITITAAQLASAGIDLSDGGETVYAYQGAINAPTNFLYAVDIADGNTTFNGSLANTGLTAGTNAVAVATDSGAYSGPTTISASYFHNGVSLIQSVSDTANWTGTDTKEAEVQREPWLTNANVDFWGTISGAGGGISRTSADPTFAGGNDDTNHIRLYDNLLNAGNNVFYSLRDISFDTVEGKFFLVDGDFAGGHSRILQGNIADLLSNPGTMPALTVLFADTGTTVASRLDNLEVDTVNNIVYFTRGDDLIKVGFDTANQAGTTLFSANVDAVSSPSGVANPAGSTNNFFNDMVINFATGAIYLSSTRVGASSGGDLVTKNFIYELTGLTTGSGVNAFTFNGTNTGTARLLPFAQNDDVYNPRPGTISSPATAANMAYFFAQEYGTLDGLAIDPVTNTLYFSTGAILFDHDQDGDPADTFYQPGIIGSYALGANAANGQGNMTVLHTQPGGQGTGLYGDLEIDTANGRLYVLDYNGVNGVNDDNHTYFIPLAGGARTQFSQTIGDSQGAAQVGFYINHAPTASANNLAATTTEASNGPGSGITGGALLWSGAALSDVDTGNTVDELAGAVVRISSNFQAGATHQDLLRIAGNTSGTIAGSGIAYNYNQATGVMILTGAATVAEYQSAIQSITFSTSGDNVTNFGNATTRGVSFAVFDGLSFSDEVATTVTVVGINDAPVNTVGGTTAATEDAGIAVTGLSVADVDADPATQDITVTLSVAHGTLAIFTNVGGGIELADVTGNGTATVTITATQNQINATFAAANGVTYTPTANYNGADTLTIVTNDLGRNGTDPGLTGNGTSEADTDTKAITIAGVNDAPTVAGDGSEDSATIFEDQPSPTGQSVASLFSGQFSDATDQQQTPSNPTGSVANTFIGIAVVGNASSPATGQWQYLNGGVWTDIGTATAAAAKLFNDETQLRFNPAFNYNGPEPVLTVVLIDSSGGASVTDAQTVNLSGVGAVGGTTRYSSNVVTLGGTVLAVNDAPTGTNLTGDAATYTENQAAPTLLDVGSNATIADIDSANFDTGTLTVAITSGGAPAQDGLVITATGGVTSTANTVSVGGVQIGTYTGGGVGGGALVFTFDPDATPAAVQALIRAIGYTNGGGDNPTAGARGVTWTLVDGDGNANNGTDTLTMTSTVNVVAVNDAPQGADATYTFNEDGSRILGAADFGYSDPGENNAFAGVVVTTLPTNGVLLLNGVPVTVAGTFVTAAQINANQLVFQADANENGTPYATFTFQVRDGGGVLNGGADTDPSPNTLTFNVNPVNDAPTSTNLNGDAATYNEGSPFVLLDVGSNATVADIDSANFDTGTLTVSITGGLVAAEDQLVITATGGVTFTANTVSVGGTQIATYTGGGAGGGSLVFTFDADATPASVQALIRAIGYTNSDLTSPTGGVRTIGWTLVDGDGIALGGADSFSVSSTVEVINVNSAPQGTDATITFNEDGSRILTAADFGFSDPAEGDDFAGVVITTLPTNGVLLLNGVPVTVAGTFVTAAQLGANQLVFQSDANENGTPYATFTFQARDDGGVANGGQDTDQSANTLTFNVTAVNDAPTSTNLQGDVATYIEGSAPVLLDFGPGATLADIDSADFDGGSLTVALGNGDVGEDGLFVETVGGITAGAGTVSFMGTQIGTFTGGGFGGGPLVFAFDADATPGAVQALLRAISYANSDGTSPTASIRTVTWTLTDGDGGAGTLTINSFVDVQAINDAPSGANATVTINEDASFTFTAADFGFSDGNGDDFAGVVITTIPVPGTLFYDADGVGTGAAAVAVTAGQFVTAADIGLGRLFFAPAANANGVPFSSFTFQVRDDAGTGNGGQDTDPSANTFTFNVTALNDAPVNSVPPAQVVNEDTNFSLSTANGNAIQVADVDASTLTVTLSAANGVLTLVSLSGLTFSTGDGTTDATMTFTGTIAAINTALGAGVIYRGNLNYNGPDAISIVTTDGGQTGNGGEQTDSDSVTLTVTARNDAPAGADATLTIPEDGSFTFTQADFGYSDPVEGNAFAGVLITTLPGDGRLLLNGVQVTVVGTFVTAAQIAAGQLVFQPDANENGAGYASFTFQVRDDGGTANSGQDTDQSANTITFNVTSVNDAPVLDLNTGTAGINDSNFFVEGSFDPAVGQAISVTDVDGNIERATITITDPIAGDTLTYSTPLPAGITVDPASTATTLILVGSASPAAYQSALGQIGFTNSGQNPTANGTDTSRTITVTVNDGTADSATATSTITVIGVNDAPAGTDTTVTGSEDDPYVFTAADFGFSDVDNNGFLAVRILTFPAQGTLFFDPDGPGGAAPVNLATVGSGVYVSVADINAGHLYFVPDADEFGNNYANFTFQVQDDGGTGGGGQDLDQTANTLTINIAPDNFAPVVDLDNGTVGVNYTTTFVEDGAAVAIGSGVIVSDPDSGLGDQIEGATITLTDRVAGDSLILTGALPPGIVAVTANAVGSITIQITGPGTGAQYQALIESIRYASTNQDPTIGGTDPARTITVTVSDGTVSSLTATTTVNITAVDDAALAQADAFTIAENGSITGGNLFADNGSGADSDPDGPPLTISAVNGQAANVGTQITLGSGALLTVNANGTFDYDTNGVYDPTPTADSGASNTPGIDGFSYTLAGGNTVNVSISLTGIDTDDTLLGTAGTDVLMGGSGNDTYYVENASDQVIEAAGAGDDRVIASVSYALAAGTSVETLQAAAGTAAINLTGNELANLILGNAGSNTLVGGLSADILEGGEGNDVIYGEGGVDTARGGLGDDVYIVDESTDIVEEAYGAGNDAVLTQVSYLLTSGAEVELLSTAVHSGTANLELTGNFGNQTIIGNFGNNMITGGVVSDVLIGLAGNDTYVVNDAQAQIVEEAGGGSDTVFVSVSYALNAGAQVEVLSTSFHFGTAAINLAGNAFGQTIYGNFGNNLIQGGGGADVLIGFGGDDLYRVDSTNAHVYEDLGGGFDQVYTAVSFTLDAGSEIEFFATVSFSGTDAINLTGNELANTIYGNAGSNVIDGKGGNDSLVGLEGADVFAFTSALGANNVDVIFGFAVGSDKIALDDAVFAGIGSLGALNPNAFVVGAAAADASDRIIYNSLTGQLFYDADGNGAGAAVHFATLNPGLPLSAGDFTVI